MAMGLVLELIYLVCTYVTQKSSVL